MFTIAIININRRRKVSIIDMFQTVSTLTFNLKN